MSCGNIFSELDKEILRSCHLQSQRLPDMHHVAPQVGIPLNWAGIYGLKYFVKTRIGSDVLTLPTTISSVTDLPASMRGFDVSRHNEVLREGIARYAKDPYEGNIVDLIDDSTVALLRKFEYSTRGHMDCTFEYPYVAEAPSGLSTHEIATVYLGAWAEKRGKDIQVTRKKVGVKVGGALACPLSFAMIRADFRHRLERMQIDPGLIDMIVEEAPLGTHMEHSYSRLILEIAPNTVVDFRELLLIVREALGVPFVEFLKRNDELSVLRQMLKENDTRFAEDVARAIVFGIVSKYPNLPGDTVVKVTQESLFTFSSYKIHVEKYATLDQLASELSL